MTVVNVEQRSSVDLTPITSLIENGLLNDAPELIEPNDDFFKAFESLSSIYIEDIKNSIKDWHPLYHKEVWDIVSTDSDFNIVERMAKEIHTSHYWDEYLYDEKI